MAETLTATPQNRAKPGIMAQLKMATAEQHHAAAAEPFQHALVRGAVTPPELRTWFCQMLLVHGPLEDHLGALMEINPSWARIFRSDQRRVPDLKHDLDVLGAESVDKSFESTLAFARHIEAIANGAEPVGLIGVLYVLEGSNNGSKYIAAAIRRAWQWPDARTLRYLDPYGDEQMHRWMEFRQDVDACGFTDGQQRAIVQAAQDSFRHISAMSAEMDRFMKASSSGGQQPPMAGAVHLSVELEQ